MKVASVQLNLKHCFLKCSNNNYCYKIWMDNGAIAYTEAGNEYRIGIKDINYGEKTCQLV